MLYALVSRQIKFNIFIPPGYTRNYEIEGDGKECRDKEPVVVVDYKTQFEKTLKKFDDKPRLRLIPTCGFKQRIM